MVNESDVDYERKGRPRMTTEIFIRTSGELELAVIELGKIIGSIFCLWRKGEKKLKALC